MTVIDAIRVVLLLAGLVIAVMLMLGKIKL